MQINSYLKSSLQNLGLSDGEAEIYFKILKNGLSEAADLKIQSKLSVAGVYKILHSLRDKGFIVANQDISRAVKFSAISITEVAKRVAAESKKLQRLSDQLKYLNNVPENLEILENEDLLSYYLNIPYKIDDFIWCVGSFVSIINFFGENVEKDFIKLRNKRGIHADAIIFDDSKFSEDLAGRDFRERRETKIMAQKNYPLVFEYLYGDTYLNFYKSDDGVLKVLKSESPELARAKLCQYQALWHSTS